VSSRPAQDPPLRGVRVISFAEIYPGPYATLLLADLGADVVMVERAKGGDPARGFPALFRALNRGKRSIALDLKQPEGVEAARRLAARADVLVEGFRPGAMERLGLGSETLRAENPGLVYASLTGFGPDSPYGTRPAHDLSFQALAGIQGDGPVGVVPWADVTCGIFGALGIIAALFGRERSGRGAHVDVAMLDGLLSVVTPSLFGALNGDDPGLPPQQPAYGCFATADGQLLSLSVTVQDAFWQRLCAALELDASDLTLAERHAQRDALAQQVAEIIATRTRDDWEARLRGADVPFGAVQGFADVAQDPHLAARGLLTLLGGEAHVRQPVRFDGHGFGPERGVPRLGEHTQELLEEVGLGADPAANGNGQTGRSVALPPEGE
jgi:crotonobetainyl-CoA:carnitine CoA-transferase CaiB-like acyl-CoA transferase